VDTVAQLHEGLAGNVVRYYASIPIYGLINPQYYTILWIYYIIHFDGFIILYNMGLSYSITSLQVRVMLELGMTADHSGQSEAGPDQIGSDGCVAEVFT
jgi:hypothetical protein